MKKYLIVIFVCFLFSCKEQTKLPNVIVMLIDNHGYHELSRNGHAIVKTPRMDKLSNESFYFTDFNAPPFCSPSRAELLTGRYALRSGINNTIGGVSIMHRDERTLADILKEKGYSTSIFGKWHLGFNYPYDPKYRGFEEVFVHGGGGVSQLEDYYGNNHMDATYVHNGEYEKSDGFSTDVLFDNAINYIETKKDQPFFCMISTPAVHFPTLRHPETTKRLLERGVEESIYLPLYSMIENVDDNVGKMLDYLKNSGLDKNTIIVLASDQGVNDRGAAEHRAKGVRRGVAYDEKHQVYCMIKAPGFEGNNQEIDELAGIVDLSPTILDLIGDDIPKNMDGVSLKGLFQDNSTFDSERKLIIQCPRKRKRNKWDNVSVKYKKWRLVNQNELYDISTDFGEEVNVYNEHPDIVEKLSAAYEEFWQSLPEEDEVLSAHVIGGNDEEIRLNSMDWYKGDAPWTQQSLPHRTSNGLWRVNVEKAGVYSFEMRRYPREADLAAEAMKGKVMIGQNSDSVKIDKDAKFGELSLDLQVGTYDMGAVFSGVDTLGNPINWGADYVYINGK